MINYFRPISEVKRTFKELSAVTRAREIEMLQNSYNRDVKDEIAFIGKTTGKTDMMGDLLNDFKNINIDLLNGL
tara:strand:- start:203 stop:424 length:222 start_codon:yes stop_codon:yes gene_type:complete